jgi:hypothetical protein
MSVLHPINWLAVRRTLLIQSAIKANGDDKHKNNYNFIYSIYCNFIYNPILIDHKYVLTNFIKEKAFLLHMQRFCMISFWMEPEHGQVWPKLVALIF